MIFQVLKQIRSKLAPLNRTFSIQSNSKNSTESTQRFAIKKIDDLNKNAEEKSEDDFLRCKLASIYRLVDLKGWSWNIYNHITVRSATNPEHFFINPFGLLYSEITASSLLKIDSNCNVIEKGSTTFGLNKAGFTLHSTIHSARNDINAVLHLHTIEASALSILKCGLLPISQEALICGLVGYHDYEGILVDEPMKERIRNDLGPKNKILILRNHGVVFCGQTLEECWFWMFNFMKAAEIQLKAMSAAQSLSDLTIPPERVLKQVQRVIEHGVNEQSKDGIEWGLGQMDLEAEIRHLDALGFSTGYKYKKTFS